MYGAIHQNHRLNCGYEKGLKNTMIITLLLLPALVIAAGLIELAVMLKVVQMMGM